MPTQCCSVEKGLTHKWLMGIICSISEHMDLGVWVIDVIVVLGQQKG